MVPIGGVNSRGMLGGDGVKEQGMVDLVGDRSYVGKELLFYGNS